MRDPAGAENCFEKQAFKDFAKFFRIISRLQLFPADECFNITSLQGTKPRLAGKRHQISQLYNLLYKLACLIHYFPDLIDIGFK
jgi:hypothetical protein